MGHENSVQTKMLNGRWLLTATPHRKIKRVCPRLMVPKGQKWLDAKVPGDVHKTLLHHNMIPDPYVGDNLKKCLWVGERDWWYKKEFQVTKSFIASNVRLVLKSLDTYGTIWLNGKFLGHTQNMFLRYEFDASEAIREGKNTLVIKIDSAIKQIAKVETKKYPADHLSSRVYARKAQCHFGWDWAPNCPPAGMMDDVRLVSYDTVKLDNVFFRTHLNGQVDILVELTEPTTKGSFEAVMHCGKDRHRIVWKAEGRKNFVSFKVKNPKLWWPQGYGPQNLYSCRLRYLCSGKVHDEWNGRTGFRQIEKFEETTKENGLSYGIKVNGIKVFFKGANWVPIDIFPAGTAESRYRTAIDRVRAANLNMLRIWGGGIYEPDLFYDLCDQAGLMIWQDFMFSSAVYPEDQSWFRELITEEARYQVRRLRNHPCIAIWCGGNEKSAAFGFHGGKEEDLFHIILPGVVHMQHPGIPYVSSSPTSYSDSGNRSTSGNNHSSCWKHILNRNPKEYRKFFETVISSNSEFCVQGPPRLMSLKKFIPKKKLWPPNTMWNYRCMRCYGHSPKYNHVLQMKNAEALIGPIRNLDDFEKYTMSVHMEYVRGEFENARRCKFDTGGTMVWMMNDSWPTANWSLVDYYGIPKPAYYAAQKACAPVIVPILDLKGKYCFYVSNDTLKPIVGTVEYGHMSVWGKKLWSKKLKVTVPANASIRFAAVPHKHAPQVKGGSFLYARFASTGRLLDQNVFFHRFWNHIQWPQPHVKMSLMSSTKADRKWESKVRVASDRFAFRVHVDAEPMKDTFFSANFFDLLPKQSKIVTIVGPKKLRPSDVRMGHWLTKWD